MTQITSSAGDGSGLIIDPASKAARVTFYDTLGNPIVSAAESQPASVAGFPLLAINDRQLLPVRADRFGSLASALHTPLLNESFEGAVVNNLRWNFIAATMLTSQSSVSGFIFNSTNITTLNTGYLLQSTARFQKTQRAPLQFKARARCNRVNNSVSELGFGDAGTFNGAHTTGAYWQVTAAGIMQPVLTFNGVDTTGPDFSSVMDSTKYYTFDILIDDDEAVYLIQDTSSGFIIARHCIKLSLTAQRLFSSTQLPAFARHYNTATAPATAGQLILSDVYVLTLDVQQGRDWATTQASLERNAIANPFSAAQSCTWANSAEPANATLSNTVPSYGTLGGKFQFAGIAGVVTDFALFGFLVPVPANLAITAVDIEAWNLGAANGASPMLLTWALGYGNNVASLASGPLVRVPLGAQDFAAAAPIGALARRLSKSFKTPLRIPSGRYLHVILRIPVGTLTASQVIAGLVAFEGYYE